MYKAMNINKNENKRPTWCGKKIETRQSNRERGFFRRLWSPYNQVLQDSNSENDCLKLFREQLFNGQVSDQKKRRRRKQMRVFDFDFREREHVNYLQMKEISAFYSVAERMHGRARCCVNE